MLTKLKGFGSSLLSSKKLTTQLNVGYIRPKKKLGPNNPFQYQEQKIKETADKDNKKYGYLQFGMYGLIIAGCFAAIPLYRIFCEHVGLVGNYEKKTYEFKPENGTGFIT